MTAAATADRVVAGKAVPTKMEMTFANETLRGGLADRKIPVIVADNVAEYVFAQNAKGAQMTVDGYPCLAPPWDHAWIEYKNQGTERRGVYVLAFDLPNMKPTERSELQGMVGEALRDAAAQAPGVEPRWALTLVLFIDDGKQVTGPVGALIWILDKHGKQLGNRWFLTPEAKWQTADGDKSMALFRMLSPALQTIAFAHCKNVVIESGQRPPPLAKKYKKRYGHEPLRWQTVRLELPRRAGERAEPRSAGMSPSLHIVSGHFSHYGDCCPGSHEPRGKLFGKLEGVFWMPQHVRGDPDREVRTDKVVKIGAVDD